MVEFCKMNAFLSVYKLEAHVPECKCSFCIGRTNNWQVALEMEWLALLFQRFSTTQFQHFQHELGILQEQKVEPFLNMFLRNKKIFHRFNLFVIDFLPVCLWK